MRECMKDLRMNKVRKCCAFCLGVAVRLISGADGNNPVH